MIGHSDNYFFQTKNATIFHTKFHPRRIQYSAMKEQIQVTEKQCAKFTSHAVSLTDRKKATITGVGKVESSNATEIVLVTCLGRLVITGTELKIERFDMTVGDVALTGNVDCIKYAAQKQPLLKRIFK